MLWLVYVFEAILNFHSIDNHSPLSTQASALGIFCFRFLNLTLSSYAQIGNSNANIFPLLLLAGSSETHLVTKGAFQELDAISLLDRQTKCSIRPPSVEVIPSSIQNAYRASWYGRPGTGFVDLPADLIQGIAESADDVQTASLVPSPPINSADLSRLSKVVALLQNAHAPLVVIGKGAAYASAEAPIRQLINTYNLPFLPTPMGKGVVADSHPLNAASARSTALKEADVVLILGARLNWILHFGDSPKWNPAARFIQVDISAEEIGKNAGDAELGIVGDIGTVVSQLIDSLGPHWRYNPHSTSAYIQHIHNSASRNEASASKKASEKKSPMTYAQVFSCIKSTIHSLSPPEDGNVVYISEGANTMDISRSIFPVEYPRLRLDAGTCATMGVGLGYAIAAHAAYNPPSQPSNSTLSEGSSGPQGKHGRKKIVAFEGDSAIGFSAMEIETMARYGMDILIFVLNNGGVYHGDSDDETEWLDMQARTNHPESSAGDTAATTSSNNPHPHPRLRSTSLSFQTRYDKIAQGCGGKGHLVHTEEELEQATRAGFQSGVVTLVNVMIASGKGAKLEFGWQASGKGGKGKGKGQGREGGAKL